MTQKEAATTLSLEQHVLGFPTHSKCLGESNDEETLNLMVADLTSVAQDASGRPENYPPEVRQAACIWLVATPLQRRALARWEVQEWQKSYGVEEARRLREEQRREGRLEYV